MFLDVSHLIIIHESIFHTFLQVINLENDGEKYLCLIIPGRLITIMSPAPASDIRAGSGICTFLRINDKNEL